MKKTYPKYTHYSDFELIGMITGEERNNEAAVYLITKKYLPVIQKMCRLFCMEDYLDDLKSEIYISLCENDWDKLKKFEGRANFGTWIGVIAYHFCLKEVKRRNKNIPLSIYNNGGPKNDDHSGDDSNNASGVLFHTFTDHDNYHLTLTIEAIRQLGNEEWQFMVAKKLEGYSSKEIAAMLEEWHRSKGITKTFTEKKVNKIFSEKIYPRLREICDNLENLYKW